MLRNTLLILMTGLASPAAWLCASEKDTPIAETRPASSLGTRAMTCVGRIQPRGLPTTYGSSQKKRNIDIESIC